MELKVYEANYRPLAYAVEEALSGIRDKRNILLISFDPRSLLPFRKKGFMRQLLIARSHLHIYVFRHFFEGVDIESCLAERGFFRRYARKHFTNVWTIESEKDLQRVAPITDTVTFQGFSPDTVRETLQKLHS